jgi:ECF sigma factor
VTSASYPVRRRDTLSSGLSCLAPQVIADVADGDVLRLGIRRAGFPKDDVEGLDDIALLETTAHVHEAYLRLHRAGYIQIPDRSHFLAYVARAMRSAVVDFARKRGTAQRGLDPNALPDPATLPAREDEILRVDQALSRRTVRSVSERASATSVSFIAAK